MNHNYLAVCIHHGLAAKMLKDPPAVRWHWRPRHCPLWAWNRNVVRRLLMRWRRE